MTIFESALTILPDSDALARHAAGWLLSEALAKSGTFSIALSGGSTPQRLYQQLGQPPIRDRFPWQRTQVFWGDERFVPHGDASSNYRMAREALLSQVPIQAGNVHPMPTEGVTPDEAAVRYERTLMDFYGGSVLDPNRPIFDVTMLGLGTDGHIASLFPGTAVLDERSRWVSAVIGAKAEPRITLTYPALESSRTIAILVAGHEKRAILDRLRNGDDSLPAARLRPAGHLHVMADAAAAKAN